MIETTVMHFFWLLFAHLLADYPLQGPFLSTEKGNHSILLYSHAGIWTGCIATAGVLIGFDIGIFDIFSLFFVHTLADGMKAKSLFWYKNMDPLEKGLWIDQSIHVLQIIFFMLFNLAI